MELNGLTFLELNLPITYNVGFGFLKLSLNFMIKNKKNMISIAVYYIKGSLYIVNKERTNI